MIDPEDRAEDRADDLGAAAPIPTVSPGANAIAGAIVDACLLRSPAEFLPPGLLAPLLREWALASLRSSHTEEATRSLVQAAVDGLRARGHLRQELPKEMLAGMRELIVRPYTPDRALVIGILSQKPFLRIARELMVGTLLDYSRRLRTTVGEGSASKGMGMLGRLATEAVRKSTSALGTLAPNMTSAVSDEFERQLQRRAAEFADGAVEEMIQRVATILTDPSRAAEHTELKLALLDFVLDRPGPLLAKELERMQPAAVSAQLRAAVGVWLEREQATADLTTALLWLQARMPNQGLQGLLVQFGVLAPVRTILCAVVAAGVQPLIENGELMRLLGAGR